MLRKSRRSAEIFAALGDETRLSIVTKLSSGQARSISQLTEDYDVTRQAITKHLRVLEDVGVVHSIRSGRENLFELDPKPIQQMKDYLAAVSEHWDQALQRLKAFVEEGE